MELSRSSFWGNQEAPEIISAVGSFRQWTTDFLGVWCVPVWSGSCLISSIVRQLWKAHIAFLSRTLAKSERNYSQLDKEALAIISASNTSMSTSMADHVRFSQITSRSCRCWASLKPPHLWLLPGYSVGLDYWELTSIASSTRQAMRMPMRMHSVIYHFPLARHKFLYHQRLSS